VPAGAPSEASGGAADDGDDEEDDSDEMAVEAGAAGSEAPVSAAQPERQGFSLFSWLRKDNEEKKP
jgi:hypothetical protein